MNFIHQEREEVIKLNNIAQTQIVDILKNIDSVNTIDLNVNSLDWRFVKEAIDETVDFSKVTEGVSGSIDFGTIAS